MKYTVKVEYAGVVMAERVYKDLMEAYRFKIDMQRLNNKLTITITDQNGRVYE